MLTEINTTGSTFQSHLTKLQDSFPQLVDSIRGRGLILGLQLKGVGGKSSTEVANMIVTKAREKGLLIITAGEGTIRFVPPLNIPQEAVSQGLEILEQAMRDAVKDIG